MTEPKSTDPTAKKIPCECGSKNCDAGLIIDKWGTVENGIIEDKVKIKIFKGDNVITAVFDKNKLMEELR